MSCQKIKPLLSAYIDRELASDVDADVTAHVQRCRQCRDLADDYRSLGRHLLDQAKASPSFELASRIRAALRSEEAGTRIGLHENSRAAVQPSRRAPMLSTIQRWTAAAAVLVLACGISAGAGWKFAVEADRTRLVEREILSAHVRSLLQDKPFQVASSDRHTVKPWFNGRADFSPPVKDLGKAGFSLLGGRLDYVEHRRVAALVYQRRLHIINVLMWPASLGTKSPVRTSTLDGYQLMTFSRDGVVYWLASDLNAEELQALADLL